MKDPVLGIIFNIAHFNIRASICSLFCFLFWRFWWLLSKVLMHFSPSYIPAPPATTERYDGEASVKLVSLFRKRDGIIEMHFRGVSNEDGNIISFATKLVKLERVYWTDFLSSVVSSTVRWDATISFSEERRIFYWWEKWEKWVTRLPESTWVRLSSNNGDFRLYFYPQSGRIRGFTKYITSFLSQLVEVTANKIVREASFDQSDKRLYHQITFIQSISNLL